MFAFSEKYWRLATTLFAAVALMACETVPTQEYSATAPNQAVLIHHDSKWRPIFDKVDLLSGRSTPSNHIRTNGIPETFDYDGKRVTPDIEKSLGLEPSRGRPSTGYRVTVWDPGDYAMIGMIRAGSNVSATYFDVFCFTGSAPVFHLEAGILNVFEGQGEIQARANAGSSYDPKIVEREESRIRFFLVDHPQLHGEVRLAPIVASVQYYQPTTPNPQAACDHADRFEIHPPRPITPAQ